MISSVVGFFVFVERNMVRGVIESGRVFVVLSKERGVDSLAPQLRS